MGCCHGPAWAAVVLPEVSRIFTLYGCGEGGAGGAEGGRDVAVYTRVFEVHIACRARLGLYLLQPPDDLFEGLYLFFPVD